jgi:hypothetical protein
VVLAGIARVADAIAVGVELIDIVHVGTVVACIANAVSIAVLLLCVRAVERGLAA